MKNKTILITFSLAFILLAHQAMADQMITGNGSGYSADLACSAAQDDARTKADTTCRRNPSSELSRFYGQGIDQRRVDENQFTCIYTAGFTCR